jgi:hypothetical protein
LILSKNYPLIKKANSEWSVIEKLIEENKLAKVEHDGKRFYMRKLPSRQK